MKCIYCNGDKFTLQDVSFQPELKGFVFEVVAPAFVCEHCKKPLMDGDQMDTLMKKTKDSYNKLIQG